MSYQALARKWRPSNFKQMVGQEHVLQALVNALDSDRLHHAYLFSGTRGVGKTTIARIFAKSLNCEQGVSSEPCGACSSCLEIDAGRSLDLIEIDAASRTGVDDMRELLDNVQYAPTRGRYKTYLIDEVHMLSKHSFNALLKTLEEPPPHVKFLLATTDPQKVPVTVLSRCLQFNLKRMSRSQIQSQLQFLVKQEAVDADEDALTQLSSAADGSMRDALSLLDQAIAYGGGAVLKETVESMLGTISRDYLLRLFDSLQSQEAASLLAEARAVIDHNPDYQRVCAEMIALLQQVALFQGNPKLAGDDQFPAALLERYASHWSAEEIQLYYQILLQGRQDLLICPDEATGFEMLMLRLIAFSPEARVPDEAEATLKKKSELIPGIPEAVDPGSPVSRGDGPSEKGSVEAARPEDPALEEPTGASVQLPPESAERLAEAGQIDAASEPAADPVTSPELSITQQISSASKTTQELDWSQTAYQLGLTGLAQEIVANSTLASYQENRLQLDLQPEIHELVNDLIKAEICEALERQIGVSLALDFNAVKSLDGLTPQQAKTGRLELERLAAIGAIREETVVRKLRQALAAELDETTVVKIEASLTNQA